jgi:hydroxyacylglutathione hydrolase
VLIRTLVVGPFGVNCFVVACEKTKEGLIIDPGDDPQTILDVIAGEKINVKYILNTHCHIDHVGAVERVRKATGATFYIHRAEEPLLAGVGQQAMLFGLRPFTVGKPDGYLKDGDRFTFGNDSLLVLETPGHSPGGVSFSAPGVVFVGDLLFAGSVGRTDLPGGSFDLLKQSILTKIVPLGEETIVYCGHGPETTVGREVKYNPFL